VVGGLPGWDELVVLRIHLDRRGATPGGRTDPKDPSASAAVFELVRGGNTPVRVTAVPVAALGIGQGVRGDQRAHEFRMPPEVVPALADQIGSVNALWLEIPAPHGYLRLVPWEQLLAPLGVPVLRLPYFALRPGNVGGSTREIAVVASTPQAKEWFPLHVLIGRYVGLVQNVLDEALGTAALIHVFADRSWNDLLRETFSGRADVVVHDQAGAAKFARPTRTRAVGTGNKVSNPWLRWVLEKLAGRAVDAVQFICHGYYAGGRGAIALAVSPIDDDDPDISRFIGAPELATFLTTAGAWAVGLTGPRGNFSPVGLLELADRLASTRPIHVLAHDSELDPELHDLEQAYPAMLAAEPLPHAPRIGNGALWVHPNLVGEARPSPIQAPASAAARLDDTGRTGLLGAATERALAAPSTPAWVAACARVLEQIQGDLLNPLGAPGGQAATAAPSEVANALRFAADLLDRHVLAATAEPAGGNTEVRSSGPGSGADAAQGEAGGGVQP
jgi:hypothetical protein